MICQGCKKDLSLLDAHRKVGHKTYCKEYKQFKLDVSNSITKEWLISEYVEKEKSLRDLVCMLDLDKPGVILDKFKEFGINVRTKKERYNSKKRIQQIKDTSLERYGHIVGVHGTQKEKMITNLKNIYNIDENTEINHPYQIPGFKKKVFDAIEKTSWERYGTKNVLSNGSYITEKIKQTLIERYGTDKLFSSIPIREKVRQTCLERYGVDNPWKSKEIHKKCMDSWANSENKSAHFSKNSQVLFWSIYVNLSDEQKSHTYFAELNKEFGKRYNDKYMFIDFVISGDTKKSIEFYGNYYHMNPAKHLEDSYNKRLKKFAKDVWDLDAKREDFIKTELGLELLIVWEKDFNDNSEEIITKCLNFINTKK